MEFEQGGKVRAEYGKGFNLAFPKCGTLSHKLTWSHYYEILKCDDPLEMQFYLKQCIKEGWKVRELKRQMKSALFQLYLPKREELQEQLDKLLEVFEP